MKKIPWKTGALAALLLAALHGEARAEGSAQTGDNQSLSTQTYIQVDVTAGEVINLAGRKFSMSPYPGTFTTGNLSVSVTRPSGQSETLTLASGSGLLPSSASTTPAQISAPYRYTAPETGRYTLRFLSVVVPFDVTVTPDATTPVTPAAPPGGRGRIFSKGWYFDAGTFAQAGATSANFYVVTPGGTGDANHVWLLDFEGLAGYVYNVAGNSLGLNGAFARSSRPGSSGATFTQEHDVFLNLPITARGDSTTPELDFEGVSGKGMTIRGSGGTFRFSSNVNGTYQIILDTNRDGNFDPSSADAVINGVAVIGENDASWNGKDSSGNDVPENGQPYAARLYLRLGEFHFAGWDIETARPGLGIFKVNPDTGVLTNATMFWDDRPVLTSNAADDPSPSETIPDGVSSSATRHAWGNFHSAGPGNNAFIDTWVFGTESSQATSIKIYGPSSDDDGDGVANAEDPYPCDPGKSSSIFIPGEGQLGLLMYEDKWPARGDLDFNDLVLAYNYEIVLNNAGVPVSLVASYTPMAIGAGYRGGFGVVLPVAASNIARVTRKVGNTKPVTHPFQAEGAGVLVDVSQDAREFFDIQSGYINTVATEPVATPRSVAIQIDLATPAAIDGALAPFDVFLFRSETPSHEIHLPSFQGTSRMNPALFGTAADGSTPGRWFVNNQGLPYALHVPVATLYPKEEIAIDQVFPAITTFAATAGASAQDFYQNNVVVTRAFSSGKSNQPRPQPQVLPRGEISLGGACP
ncbi:MAG: LruC domain-containing protein [Polyangiaceae bacterium]|jgi:LruC domain-containing protein|nr:LruC domain-containing protein [Polyangiaceae bacterium]